MALVLCCDGIAHLASRIASVNCAPASSTVLGCDPEEAILLWSLSQPAYDCAPTTVFRSSASDNGVVLYHL